MIQYRKILELHFNNVSQRTISTSVGSSRNTVSDITKRAKKLGLERLTDNMNNHWLEELCFAIVLYKRLQRKIHNVATR